MELPIQSCVLKPSCVYKSGVVGKGEDGARVGQVFNYQGGEGGETGPGWAEGQSSGSTGSQDGVVGDPLRMRVEV